MQVEELKDRLPPFQAKEMGLHEEDWAKGGNISDEGLDRVIQVCMSLCSLSC